MDHYHVCCVCKTVYISALNRSRCESSTDSHHRIRDPKHGFHEPCLVPSLFGCGIWSRLQRWWDGLPGHEAAQILLASTQFGPFYLNMEENFRQQLGRGIYSDIDVLARHPLVLQSAMDGGVPLPTSYTVAAGMHRLADHPPRMPS
jgi:hypothetical protein